MNPAIYFLSEAYSTKTARLMGRHAAGEGFLKAYCRHAAADVLHCYAPTNSEAEAFAAFCAEAGVTGKSVRWIPFGQVGALREAGTLFYPGPELALMSWARRRVGGAAYSLVGVAHTISSGGAMDSLCDMLASPVEPWDALVCTSASMLDATRRVLGEYGEFLAQRFSAGKVPQITLAMIPLGVDCEQLAPSQTSRAAWRSRLGIGEGDLAVLFLGRLSFHAKANPLPMYLGLEEAARRSAKRIHLIQAGWFAHESIEKEFRLGAQQLCPSVNAIFLDGRDSGVRKGIWHAADLFTSLSDNVQETFGLAPVEAMAAGLPCVVSDWDGYRDTVRDGVDGLKIPTLAPPPGLGTDLAIRYEDGLDNYDKYIANTSLFVSVDVRACADAYTRLAMDGELRRSMGASARKRALETFDWPVIIRRYESLWEELAQMRAKGAASDPGKAPAIANPGRADPYWMFASYPTAHLLPASHLWPVNSDGIERLRVLRKTAMVSYGDQLLADESTSEAILALVETTPGITVEDVIRKFDGGRERVVWRGLAWLAKLGLVRAAPG